MLTNWFRRDYNELLTSTQRGLWKITLLSKQKEARGKAGLASRLRISSIPDSSSVTAGFLVLPLQSAIISHLMSLLENPTALLWTNDREKASVTSYAIIRADSPSHIPAKSWVPLGFSRQPLGIAALKSKWTKVSALLVAMCPGSSLGLLCSHLLPKLCPCSPRPHSSTFPGNFVYSEAALSSPRLCMQPPVR